MIDWKRKLTSRKFWGCVANFVSMLLIALHVAQETATQVTALIMAGAGVIAYIIGEGMADSATNLEELQIEKVLYDDADDNNQGGVRND